MKTFRQFTEARNQLEYKEWGVIEPNGKVVDANKIPGVETHWGLLMDIYHIPSQEESYERGFVRWFLEDNDLYFDFKPTEETINNVIKFVRNYHGLPERYYFDCWAKPTKTGWADHRPGAAPPGGRRQLFGQ